MSSRLARKVFGLAAILAACVFMWVTLGHGRPAAVAPQGRYKAKIPDPKFFHPAPKNYVDTKCLRALRSLRVPFRRHRRIGGVATPVIVLGRKIGHIRYSHLHGKHRMLMDCRLALAMKRASPILHVNFVAEVIYSNFYSWRRVKKTHRLSRHSLGLAVDIHAFRSTNGRRVTLTRHYEKGLGRGQTCEGRAKTWQGRMLRDLACDLDESNLFERILTPDYDRDHEDHFHLGIFHPQDRKRYRIYRTVLPEVRGVMWPWAWKRPVTAWYSTARIRRIVRNRRHKRRNWHYWRKVAKSRTRTLRRGSRGR